MRDAYPGEGEDWAVFCTTRGYRFCILAGCWRVWVATMHVMCVCFFTMLCLWNQQVSDRGNRGCWENRFKQGVCAILFGHTDPPPWLGDGFFFMADGTTAQIQPKPGKVAPLHECVHHFGIGPFLSPGDLQSVYDWRGLRRGWRSTLMMNIVWWGEISWMPAMEGGRGWHWALPWPSPSCLPHSEHCREGGRDPPLKSGDKIS